MDFVEMQSRLSNLLSLDEWETPHIIASIALIGLFFRLFGLGSMPAHFDEGRVAYWALHYIRTGDFAYQYIIHGPHIRIVSASLFNVFGTSDFTMRLYPAVLSALAPLAILLYREHLHDYDMIAAAIFLTFEPLILYYSRFYRSTILLTTFMLFALGLFVRYYDTRARRYLFAGVAMFALGATAKENFLVYPITWLGALGVVFGSRTLIDARGDRGTYLRSHLDAIRDAVTPRAIASVAVSLLGSTLIFAAITFFFYAPRAGGDAVGLYNVLFNNPAQFPELVRLTLSTVTDGYHYWMFESSTANSACPINLPVGTTLCIGTRFGVVLFLHSAVTVVFAVGGFFAEYSWVEKPRWIVIFTAAWAGASLIGYSHGTDIFGPWVLVNTTVPLAITAGVGVGHAVRYTEWASTPKQRGRAKALLLVALILTVHGAFVIQQDVYANPTADSNELVQYGQPSMEFKPIYEKMTRAVDASTGTGPDVLLVNQGYARTEGLNNCGAFYDTLPMAWYFSQEEFTVSCATSVNQLGTLDGPPTTVMTDPGVAREIQLSYENASYKRYTFNLRTGEDKTVVLIRRSALQNATTQPAVTLPTGSAPVGRSGLST